MADDLLKNDGQKFLEMMEQLAERRMQREEEAAAEIEEDSEEDQSDLDGEDGSEVGEEADEEADDISDEDDEDEDGDDADEVCGVIPSVVILSPHCPFLASHDGGREDGAGQEDVLHLRCADVRATGAAGLPGEGRAGASTAIVAGTRGGGQVYERARGEEADSEPEEEG